MSATPRTQRLAILSAALILALAGVARAEKHALLVGINEYPQIPLRYCVNDIEDVKKMLIEHYGFSEANITMLTDAAATREGILSAAQTKLVDGSKPGDVVFFHYSGHGTHIDDKSGDEEDGQDEALCPVDCIGDDTKLILDDEMGELAQKLADRQFVAVYDSCHSGTGLRNLDPRFTGRYLPPRFLQPAAARGALDQLFTGAGGSTVPNEGPYRPTDGMDTAGHAGLYRGLEPIFVSGCKADEVSSDGISFEGQMQPNGAMTFHFVRGMKGSADTNGDGQVSGSELSEYFAQQFPESDTSVQHPQVEAPDARLQLPVVPDLTGATAGDTTTGGGSTGGGTTGGGAIDIGADDGGPWIEGDDYGGGFGGFLELLAQILILLDNLSRSTAAAPVNQDVWLTAQVNTRQAPRANVSEVAIWQFFDANGNWIPNKEAVYLQAPSAGRSTYRARYRSDGAAPGAYSFFSLSWVDPQSRQALDNVFALRPVPAADSSGMSRGWRGGTLKAGQARSILAAREAKLLDAASLFATRQGVGGLTVSIAAEAQGAQVSFQITANQPCQAILLDLSSSGKLQMIHPSTPGGAPLQLTANQGVRFPQAGGFRMSGPSGLEHVAAVALPTAATTQGGAAEIASAWLAAGCASSAVALQIQDQPAKLVREGSGVIVPGPASSGSRPPAATPAPGGANPLQNLFQ